MPLLCLLWFPLTVQCLRLLMFPLMVLCLRLPLKLPQRTYGLQPSISGLFVQTQGAMKQKHADFTTLALYQMYITGFLTATAFATNTNC